MNGVPRPDAWRGRRVLVTGHTGFIGGWLAAWLARLGARVTGIALAPPAGPGFFRDVGLERCLEASEIVDLRDHAATRDAVDRSRAEIVFHLAAQAIVREAWRHPVETFASNVMGTVHLLDACRRLDSLQTVVAYTTDKVYRDLPPADGHSETDPLGGPEPYSASKVGAEWAIEAYWKSFLAPGPRSLRLVRLRAGNILGGGDWATDRLLPDAVRAFSEGRLLEIRHPEATRPWQHVLDAVRGTLLAAEQAGPGLCTWNLGPSAAQALPVSEIVRYACEAWGAGARWAHVPDGGIAEAGALVLSPAKAAKDLGWRAAWNARTAVERSIAWYRSALAGKDMAQFTGAQIDQHLRDVQ